MKQSLVSYFVCASTLLVTLTPATAEVGTNLEVSFMAGPAVPTTLGECLEALEDGTAMGFADEEISGDRFVKVVLYDRHFFAFMIAGFDEVSRCRKVPFFEVGPENPVEGQHDLLPPAD